MKQPLLSIIIPTHSRPQFLSRAIDSALQSGPDDSTEVIVVPNGSIESWKPAAQSYASDPRVHWHPILPAHANAARNHGLQLAHGKYIRFLDDDDYLLKGARKQCIQLDTSRCDASQGGIDFVDKNGNTFDSRKTYSTQDFLIAILAPNIFTATHSILWKREAIAKRVWSTNQNIGQDVAFALEIARDNEILFHNCEFQVGAWVHHDGNRISKSVDYSVHAKTQADLLIDTIHGLEKRSAMTPLRREWLSKNLWKLIHSHFPSSPIFWTKYARFNQEFFPRGRPDDTYFKHFPFAQTPPLVTEWLITPHRFIRHHMSKKISEYASKNNWIQSS